MNIVESYIRKTDSPSWLFSQAIEFYNECRREMTPIYTMGNARPQSFSRGNRSLTAQFVFRESNMIQVAIDSFCKKLRSMSEGSEATIRFAIGGNELDITIKQELFEFMGYPTIERYRHEKSEQAAIFMSFKYSELIAKGDLENELMREIQDRSKGTDPFTRVALSLAQLD